MAATTTGNTPQIIINISTTAPALSLSSISPFTIILTAHVSGPRPLCIDATRTILDSHDPAALDSDGLTFTDVATGQLADRMRVHVNYRVPDVRTIGRDYAGVVAIPAEGSGEVCEVRHTFIVPPRSSGGESSTVEEEILGAYDQVKGFEVGRTYEIGLGTGMSEVEWWEEGSLDEVFARGPMRRVARERKVGMVLEKTARFEVVG